MLLWWTTVRDRYDVFYGDLRADTLKLTDSEWSRLVPPPDAAGEKKSQ